MPTRQYTLPRRPGRRPTISPNVQESVAELIRQRLTYPEILKCFPALTREAIRRIANRYQLWLEPVKQVYPRDWVRIRAISKLYEIYGSVTDVAAELQCSIPKVSRDLALARQEGITP